MTKLEATDSLKLYHKMNDLNLSNEGSIFWYNWEKSGASPPVSLNDYTPLNSYNYLYFPLTRDWKQSHNSTSKTSNEEGKVTCDDKEGVVECISTTQNPSLFHSPTTLPLSILVFIFLILQAAIEINNVCKVGFIISDLSWDKYSSTCAASQLQYTIKKKTQVMVNEMFSVVVAVEEWVQGESVPADWHTHSPHQHQSCASVMWICREQRFGKTDGGGIRFNYLR